MQREQHFQHIPAKGYSYRVVFFSIYLGTRILSEWPEAVCLASFPQNYLFMIVTPAYVLWIPYICVGQTIHEGFKCKKCVMLMCLIINEHKGVMPHVMQLEFYSM